MTEDEMRQINLEAADLIHGLIALSDKTLLALKMGLAVDDYSSPEAKLMVRGNFEIAMTTIEFLQHVVKKQAEHAFEIDEQLDSIIKKFSK